MTRPHCLTSSFSGPRALRYSTSVKRPPIIAIDNGTFYRRYPSPEAEDASSNPHIFPGLKFSLPSDAIRKEHWAVIGLSNSGKTTLLEILRGKHVVLPPTARSFPYLSSDDADPRHRSASRAIHYVGFEGERGGVGKSGTRGAYMSARYESRRESTDFSVLDFLRGNTDLNPAEEQEGKFVDKKSLDQVIEDLKLGELLSMPIGNLSNGQTRRARIARALLGKPLVLLLDEPFMGLDPPTTKSLSPLLYGLAKAGSPRLILALRPQDPLPDWITHLVQLGPSLQVAYQGDKDGALDHVMIQSLATTPSDGSRRSQIIHAGLPIVLPPEKDSTKPKRSRRSSREGLPSQRRILGLDTEKVVEMQDVHVKYGDKEVLGDWDVKPSGNSKRQIGLWWDVRRGERWGVFGPNGSGKTTLISLICSDHPLSYSLPIKIFGQNRLPQRGKPGISIFDIQARIGQSSPEIHAFFPRTISLRQVVENAWAETFLGTPRLTYESDMAVDACLRWFEAELNPAFDASSSETKDVNGVIIALPRDTSWADDLRFGECPFSAQRVALFLRAIVKKPEMVVLDEAFSGMDEYVRDKCMLFLTWGETYTFGIKAGDPEKRRYAIPTRPDIHEGPLIEGIQKDQTLICVSHVKEEVPGLLSSWMCLPEAGTGEPARFGFFEKPLDKAPEQWEKIWGV